MAWHGEIRVTDGGNYVVDVIASGGELRKRLLAHPERIALSEADLEDALARESHPFGAAGVRELGAPPVRPVAGRMLVARSGRELLNRLDLSAVPWDPEDESGFT